MYKLGTVIRDQLETLAAEYERWLQQNKDYARMPAQARLDAARLMLSLVAAWLEAGDADSFAQFIHSRAQERAEQGFEMDALLHALNGLEQTLLPLVDDVETAKFLWHSTAQARTVISDIVTERAHAVERGSRQLIERVSLGIFRTTPEGRIVEANPAFFEIVGYDSLEAINRVGVPALYENPADRERLMALLQQGPVTGFETRFRRGDGRIVHVSLSVRLIEVEGARFLEGCHRAQAGRGSIAGERGQL
jgi:PAS domain S-box-containing protein